MRVLKTHTLHPGAPQVGLRILQCHIMMVAWRRELLHTAGAHCGFRRSVRGVITEVSSVVWLPHLAACARTA